MHGDGRTDGHTDVRTDTMCENNDQLSDRDVMGQEEITWQLQSPQKFFRYAQRFSPFTQVTPLDVAEVAQSNSRERQ